MALGPMMAGQAGGLLSLLMQALSEDQSPDVEAGVAPPGGPPADEGEETLLPSSSEDSPQKLLSDFRTAMQTAPSAIAEDVQAKGGSFADAVRVLQGGQPKRPHPTNRLLEAALADLTPQQRSEAPGYLTNIPIPEASQAQLKQLEIPGVPGFYNYGGLPKEVLDTVPRGDMSPRSLNAPKEYYPGPLSDEEKLALATFAKEGYGAPETPMEVDARAFLKQAQARKAAEPTGIAKLLQEAYARSMGSAAGSAGVDPSLPPDEMRQQIQNARVKEAEPTPEEAGKAAAIKKRAEEKQRLRLDAEGLADEALSSNMDEAGLNDLLTQYSLKDKLFRDQPDQVDQTKLRRITAAVKEVLKERTESPQAPTAEGAVAQTRRNVAQAERRATPATAEEGQQREWSARQLDPSQDAYAKRTWKDVRIDDLVWFPAKNAYLRVIEKDPQTGAPKFDPTPIPSK